MSPPINKLEGGLKLTLSFFLLVISLAPSEGLSQWTDPVLTPRVTPIKAVHINQLRIQINAKLAGCGQPAQSWTNAAITSGMTTIKKADLDELRTATTNLVNTYRAQASLPPSPPAYTDPVITARTTSIKAAHIDELRTLVAGSTCTPGCPPQVLVWHVGANACSAAAPSVAIGFSAVLSDSVVPVTGNAQFDCNAGGVWAAHPHAGATCDSGCLLNLPLGWDNGIYPLVSCYSLPLLPFQTISVPEGATHTEQGFGGTPRCGEISIKCVSGSLVTIAKTCDLGVCP